MKKKWWILLAAVLVLAIVAGGAVYYFSQSGNDLLSYSSGRYLRTEGGMDLIILDGCPVVMSNRTDDQALFDGLKTGDEIRILHDLIQESYPGRTGVYKCKRVSEGTIADIPESILESISPMGYTVVDGQGKTKEIYTGTVTDYEESNGRIRFVLDFLVERELTVTVLQSTDTVFCDGLAVDDRIRVECHRENDMLVADSVVELQAVFYEYGSANMCVVLPGNWEYEILEYSDESYSFGIRFRPEGVSGSVSVLYYPQGFGVCGTGLDQEQIRLDSGLKAYQGTYDGKQYWDFISVQGLPGSYVFQTEKVSAWPQELFSQAEQIVYAASLAEGILWENSVAEYARRECGGDCEVIRTSFDFCSGEWTVWLQAGDTEYTLGYSAEGELLYKENSAAEILVSEKPVIYLYPEAEQAVSVKLFFDGTLTSTYPRYEDGWEVVAEPDGTLTDPQTGRIYYCLFWEGISNTEYDFSKGFVVAGADTVAFLEDALAKLGLTDREANEFIIYWAPRMESNAYNLISFQTDAYTDSAVLKIDPQPETLLRVFMAWKVLEAPVQVAPQELTAPQRSGFTVVEWGGAEVTG